MPSGYELKDLLLKIDHVSLNYGDKVILRDVNAEIYNIVRSECTTGQVVGFLGPSGIGKTQLFRIIAGLNKPTSGSVELMNNGINRPVHPGEVGVVAQNYPLFENRTIFGNLMLAALQKNLSKKDAKDKVHEMLEQFQLMDRATLYPCQLSGGQRQRAAILQQLLCSEHFILMDEPFSGLDLVMLEKVAHLISQIASMDELNTVIIVTHDITTAASVSDHLWLMGRDRDEQGNIIPGARIQEVYNLIDLDLCWQPNIITQPRFLGFVSQVKERFRSL